MTLKKISDISKFSRQSISFWNKNGILIKKLREHEIPEPDIDKILLEMPSKKAITEKTQRVSQLEKDIASKKKQIEKNEQKIEKLLIDNKELTKIVKYLERCCYAEFSAEVVEPLPQPLGGSTNITTKEKSVQEKNNVLSSLGENANAMKTGQKEKTAEIAKKEYKPPKQDSSGEYELWPDNGKYDFYKNIKFTAENKHRFLQIKASEYSSKVRKPPDGEYRPEFEILPDGVSARELSVMRKKKTYDLDLKNFMKWKKLKQVKYVFQQSGEVLDYLKERLDNEKEKILEGSNKKFTQLVEDFYEWMYLITAYYRWLVVSEFFPEEKDPITRDKWTVDCESISVPKGRIETLEKWRLKWLKLLPADLQKISLLDSPIYIMKTNPDAWVNPETLEFEIRKPKAKFSKKQIDELPFAERVRYLNYEVIKDLEIMSHNSLMSMNDFDEKEKYRIEYFTLRSERRAREAKEQYE